MTKQEKRNEIVRRYRANNSEKFKEYRRKHREKNRDILNQKQREYCLKNKEKRYAYDKKYREANREKTKLNVQKHFLKRFNLTIEDFNTMMIKQNNKCKICNIHRDQVTKNFNVDHCHKTGKVRGLLCLNCNTGLGQFKDNIELMIKAIQYLTDKAA